MSGLQRPSGRSFRVEPDAGDRDESANPGTLTPDSAARLPECRGQPLQVWGLQSASEEELRLLGPRIQPREQFLQVFRAARDAGFDNINVDLMSALPGQSEESWQETLRFVCDLEPEHISTHDNRLCGRRHAVI
ncbi:MAG: radical SAM protein [Clostridium fessum]